jgi:hypothetical protein
MEKKLQSIHSSSETAEQKTIDDDEDIKLHPNTQARCWDGFHTAHCTGNFFLSLSHYLGLPSILTPLIAQVTSLNLVGTS